MAAKSKKRIPPKEDTVRTCVPKSLITIKDKYKKNIKENLKDKHKDSLSDRVVLEIVLKSLKDIPEKEIMKIVLKKIPKKYLR